MQRYDWGGQVSFPQRCQTPLSITVFSALRGEGTRTIPKKKEGIIFAKGAIIVTFVNSGVTIYAPSGLLLKQDKMASLICTATNNFNLTGELATS